MNKIFKRWIPFALVFGVVLYLCVYFWGLHSDSFAFVQKSLVSAPAITSRVGRVEHVKLDPLGGYSESFVDSSRTAKMSVIISGSEAETTAVVIATKSDGRWQLSQVIIGGKSIELPQGPEGN